MILNGVDVRLSWVCERGRIYPDPIHEEGVLMHPDTWRYLENHWTEICNAEFLKGLEIRPYAMSARDV